jgi:hypothetical protein
MWFRRFLWWLNGYGLDAAVANLEQEIEGLHAFTEQQVEQFDAARRDLEAMTARFRQLCSPEFPQVKLWEAAQVGPFYRQPASSEPLYANFEDRLCLWLWKQAWDACSETGNWDLLTAAAGIARGIRTEGIPLSAGLWAAAASRGGSE